MLKNPVLTLQSGIFDIVGLMGGIAKDCARKEQVN